MDWTAAIEKNQEALKRILAALVAVARPAESGSTLPRHLHRAVLRLSRRSPVCAAYLRSCGGERIFTILADVLSLPKGRLAS